MSRHWLFPSRTTEATPQQLVATGAAGGAYMVDPIDGDVGYARVGGGGSREQPWWTTKKVRAYSIAAYRSNPMARAIIDTYTSFAVGDSGVSLECDDPLVRAVLDEWWEDPKNRLGEIQTDLCRDWLLQGEVVYELLVGAESGVVRFSPIDPGRVDQVVLDRGNPLWHDELVVAKRDQPMKVVQVDDVTGLRTGDVLFVPSWRAVLTDTRGTPFLEPVLDDLDSYQQVISNLVDRTALARYLVWDVEVQGGQTEVDDFIKARGGLHVPRSGTVEVHNQGVKWEPKAAPSGSFEDTNTAAGVLTNVASGVGLSKPWLAESEGANRATSLSMAEPVRRRVGAVQGDWLRIMRQFAQYTVDRAVAAGRLPRMVWTTDVAGAEVLVSPSRLVRVKGPEVAAADATVTSNVFLNLSTALQTMVESGVLSQDAARVAAQKAWEMLVGQPWRTDLSPGDGPGTAGVPAGADAAA